MKRVALIFLAAFCVLTGCSGVQQGATRGAAALGQRLTTMDELVDWMRDSAGGCDEVIPQTSEALVEFLGPDNAARFEPYVAEWATCSVSAEFPRVGLVLFEGDAQRKFQESWHDAMTDGEVADGPSFAFGNGFGVSAGALGVSRLGLYWFLCDYTDPTAHRIPADEQDCVFANSEHAHG
ncbi:hypothetical protein [Actinophytocola oryzae]|uniref:LppA-like lipoprotein n=1 Tax=Actinophytocola oryzae TaxID=502181 RepID=A0A4V3FRT0_9PSEU|nr:hypothetical protein [Actinophytocola oryzae]TDV44761.1 hypothetical protein CLV71_11319 [Actinophytocola oryzae]